MTIDLKELFQQLLGNLRLEESRDEKESILFWVMEHELGLTKAEVMSGREVLVNEPSLQHIMDRLNKHEPIQYILGEAEFYGRKFGVGPGILIPRPETEHLIEVVLDHFQKEQAITILDIGAGSGCVAITLALEFPCAMVIATDISREVLTMAAANAERLHAKIQFTSHDILKDSLDFGQLDAVVSNPPYIMEHEKTSMPENVVDFEPSHALFVPDASPLLFHTAIAKKAMLSLKHGGLLITEINEALGRETSALFRSIGYQDVKIINDLRGKERIVKGKKP